MPLEIDENATAYCRLVGRRWDDWRSENRAHWDDRTAVHVVSRFYDVERWLRQRPGPRPWEANALGDVSGLTLVHLQCHFGLDTLAWARVGARVTGLDFSPAAIEAARELAERAGLADRARFVCADVYEADQVLDGETYDVVYVSLGALCWLPSVERWAEQVSGLLRKGGRLYLHDSHPLSWALAEGSLVVEHTYFEEPEPYISDSPNTYTDADRELTAQRSYEWNHSLGEIVTSLARSGLRLERLEEHDWTVWPRFSWLVPRPDGRWTTPPDRPRVPLSFTLLTAKRPAGGAF